MEIKHISLKNIDAGNTSIVVSYIYIHTHIQDDGGGMDEIRGAHIWGDIQRGKLDVTYRQLDIEMMIYK